MRRLFLFLALCPALFASNQALVLGNTSAYAQVTFPNSGVFQNSALASWESVVRLHGCTTGNNLLTNNAFQLETNCSNYAQFTSNWDGPSGANATLYALPVCSSGDYTFRTRRDNAAQALSLEVWCTNTGAYVSTINNSAGPWGNNFNSGSSLFASQFNIGTNGYYSGTAASFDYVRIFNTVEPMSATFPTAAPGGNVVDYEFDGNANDSSGNHQNLSLSGNTSYALTPAYPPTVAFSAAGQSCFLNTYYPTPFCVLKAGTTAQLFSSAQSPNTGDVLTYSWTQLSGPLTATVTGASSATATASGLNAFGDYAFQLSVTDLEGNNVRNTLHIGAYTLQSGSTCLISDVPASLQMSVGPLTPWGTGSPCSPWPWYDEAEAANGEMLQLKFQTDATYLNALTPAAGTITISGPSYAPVAAGSGTNFTTACGGGSCADWLFWAVWSAPLGSSPAVTVSGNTGRALFHVNSVSGPTSANLDGGFGTEGVTISGAKWIPIGSWNGGSPSGETGNLVFGFDWSGQPSYGWDYYDNVLALYRLYYRTGISVFQTYARQLADYWYIYHLDQGYRGDPPRTKGLAGLMARAIDGEPAYWTGIEQSLEGFGTSNPNGAFDPRESGYNLGFDALDVELDPSANKSLVCSWISNGINYTFGPDIASGGNGGIWSNNYAINNSLPSYGYGTEPWILAVPATGFRDAYIALTDTNGCNNPTLAATTLGYITGLVNFIYTNGIGGTRTIPTANGGGQGSSGEYYQVGYQASGEDPGSWGVGQGNVSGSSGSTTITGTGTNFTAPTGITSSTNGSNLSGGFGPCNGTTFIAIPGVNEVHKVTACASNTSLTVAEPVVNSFNGQNGYQIVAQDTSSNCAPSRTPFCFGGTSTDYQVSLPGIFGWLYSTSQNAQYQVWGDDLFSGSYGGPAGGPGSSGLAAGPMSSGQTVSGYGYITALPPCNSAAPPCGGAVWHWGKDFGDGSGYAGAADNYLAYRLTVPSSQCGAKQ